MDNLDYINPKTGKLEKIDIPYKTLYIATEEDYEELLELIALGKEYKKKLEEVE